MKIDKIEIAGIMCIMCIIALLGLFGYCLYDQDRDPILLSKESVGKIIKVNGIGGYRSDPRLEVTTDTGNVFILNSTPPIRIGSEAYLHTWDKDWTKHSLSWDGSSGLSWYLAD